MKKNLPENFDWRSFYHLSKVKNQGKCENCWSISMTTWFSAVLKIKSKGKIDVEFSIKNFASDNQTGDGDWCYGGSYVLATLEKFTKYGSESKGGKRYYPRKIYMIEEIEENIMNNGPQLATMYVYSLPGNMNLRNYKGGIYGVNWWNGEDFSCDAEYHTVVIVGWGVEHGVRYWIVRNSWGPSFGEGGYFRILRGYNFCKIEEKVFSVLI